MAFQYICWLSLGLLELENLHFPVQQGHLPEGVSFTDDALVPSSSQRSGCKKKTFSHMHYQRTAAYKALLIQPVDSSHFL